MKRNFIMVLVLAVVLAQGCPWISGGQGKAFAKGKAITKRVKVGRRISLGNSEKGTVYKSSNTRVASVDSGGMVTGKKTGTVKITRKDGKTKKTYTINVVKNPGKPDSLPVTLDEVALMAEQIEMQPPDGAVYSARIRNNSSKGTVRKIRYRFEIQAKVPVSSSDTGENNSGAATDGTTTSEESDAGDAASGNTASGGTISGNPAEEETKTKLQKKTVTITAKNIAAGKTSGVVQCEGDYTGLVSNMKLKQIDLYTGSARQCYTVSNGNYLFDWGTADKKAPKITGLVKGKSCTGHNDPYQTVYTDQKKNWRLTRFVQAVDDRDGKVKVKADTSKVNMKKTGTYKVYFTARDKAGNVAKSWAKVRVIVPGTAESAADRVLRSITRKGWSDVKKARAIYRYVRGHCGYVNNAAHRDWRTSALQGIRYQSGDCYTYYAVSRLLLTRAGIPNVMINREPAPGGMRHYWNLAYVKGG